MHQIRSIIRAVLLLLSAALLAGCGPESSAPPIRVSTSYWVGYEPFFAAEAKGFFPPGSVHLLENANALTLEQTMRSDTIDAIAVSLTRALNYAELGHEVSIVLVLGWSNGADRLLARPSIKHIKDLKGKRVGTELSTVNTYLLLRALQKNEMSLNDIKLVPLSNETMAESFINGNIDAASAYARSAATIQKKGGNILFSSADIPGEIMDVLLVRTQYMEAHPERVEQLITGLIRAVNSLKSSPEKNTAKAYLINQEEYALTAPLVTFASDTDNNHYLENNGEKLRDLIQKRYRIQAILGKEPDIRIQPYINSEPFLAAQKNKMFHE